MFDVLFGPAGFIPVGRAALLPASPPSPVAAPQTVNPAFNPGEVKIDVAAFGVGNVARIGDWIGLRLRLTDSALQSRDALVQILGRDNDSDHPAYRRIITLNPGVAQDAWFYFRLPAYFGPSDTFEVVISEPVAPAETASLLNFRAGRTLARRTISSAGAQLLDPAAGLMVTLGAVTSALQPYAISAGNPGVPDFGHEILVQAALADLADLPDRWMGLKPASVMVWGAGVDPSGLRAERARALREWVRRGGHLIVVLPPTGTSWINPATNELHDLFPLVNVARREGVDLAPYRPLFTSRSGVAMPRGVVVNTFEPLAGAGPGEADPVLNAPDGSCVVVQRAVGVGAVTLIGIDLSNAAFRTGTVPQTEAFWHRILGRRGTLSVPNNIVPPQRSLAYLDDWVGVSVAKRGTAAAGLLMGFLVFLAYWLVAGPFTYYALRRANLVRHSWLAFVGAAALFTAIAFGLASLFKPGRVEALHFTVLDHVYGQSVQRARSFFSLYVPTAGNTELLLGGADGNPPPRDGVTRELGGVLAPWEAPEASGGVGFLDSREYPVDARDPTAVTFASRATVKQFSAEWAGAPRYKMPAVIPAAGASEGRIFLDSDRTLTGQVRNDLDRPLTNVTILLVEGQTTLGRPQVSDLGEAPLFGRAVSLREWLPQQVIDLSDAFRGGTGGATPISTYLNGLVPAAGGFIPGTVRLDPAGAIAPISFYPLIGTPQPDSRSNLNAAGFTALRRRLFHGLDLGRWFTRPCVIIVGTLPEHDTPVPLFVDGTPVESRGTTIVRWVYPLAPDPPAYPDRAPAATPSSGSSPDDPPLPPTAPDPA